MTAMREGFHPVARAERLPRVRLLWLIDSLNMGGAESLVLPFATAVDPARYELFVCCLSVSGANVVEQELRARGVPTVNLSARNLRDVRAFRRLLKLVRDQQIQLVHAHLTYSAIWAALLSRIAGVPSVVSLHVAASATRALETSRVRRALARVRDRLMRHVTSRWSSRIIMVSAGLRASYAVERAALDQRKVRIVHNGIDTRAFARDRRETRAWLAREFDLPPDVPLAVTVSVLRPGKGIEVLLGAARLLPDVWFLIVGDGTMRDAWAALAAANGIRHRVCWAGFRRDVDAILPGCDLFIHPSFEDAFPTVLLEAMAAGLPVVASRVGGIPEIVVPDVTGRLVDAGDAERLASAVKSLLSDDEAMARMRDNARARAEREFSTDAWIARLSAIYSEALAEREKGRD